jgi:Protein of unknown function (DUF1573)
MYLWVFCGIVTAVMMGMVTVRSYESHSPVSSETGVIFEDPIFDFGKESQQTKVEHSFSLYNRGSNDAVVAGVRTSCSCTVVTRSNLLSRIIKPHERLPIPTTFDTGTQEGDAGSSIEVMILSAGASEAVKASVKGTVVVDYTVSRFLDYGFVKPGQEVTRSVVFHPVALRSLQVGPPLGSNLEFNVSLTNRPSDTEAFVTFHVPNLPRRQAFSEVMEFPTSSKREPTHKVYLIAQIQPDVEITPDMLILTEAESYKDLTFNIRTIEPSRVVSATGIADGVTFPISASTSTLGNGVVESYDVHLLHVPLSGTASIHFAVACQSEGQSLRTNFLAVPIHNLKTSSLTSKGIQYE